jgi:hypothetical protein
MPITLGILAQSRQAVAQGAFQLLETAIVSGSSTSEVLFSNLNNYAATYQHLQIRYAARTGETSFNREDLCYRFNGVTSNSYTEHNLSGGSGSTPTSGATTSFNRGFIGSMATNFESSGIFGAGVIDILDPFETTKNTTVRTLAGRAGSTPMNLSLQSSLFISTDAIASMRIFTSSNRILVAGTRFSLYGIKATA